MPIIMEANLADSPKYMDESELGDLNIQGIEEDCKQNFPISEPHLELFKKVLIKAITTSRNLSKTIGKYHSLGI